MLILVLFVTYKNTNFSLSDLSKVFSRHLEYSEYVDISLILSYVGSFIILMSTVTTHLYSIFYPQVQAYLLIGFKDFPAILGFSSIFIGLGVFNWRFIKQTGFFELDQTISILLRFVPLSIIFGFSLVLISLVNVEWASNILKFDTLFVVVTVIIQIFAVKYGKFKSNIVRMRFVLLTVIYFAFFMLLVTAFKFLPFGSNRTLWPTRNPSVEILIFLTNIYAVFVGYLLFLIVNPDEWLRNAFKISDAEYHQYINSMYMGNKGNQKSISMKLNQENYQINLMELLDKGYVCFTNLDDEFLQDYILMEKIKDSFDILKKFDLENAKDTYFYKILSKNSNFLFLADSDNEGLDSLIDEIYHAYHWDISIIDDKVILDNYTYSSHDWMVALIFSGNSVWNEKYWIQLFLVPDPVKIAFARFIENYSDFIESLSIEGPFLLILFFNTDGDGEYIKIAPDNINPNFPDQQSYRLFRKKSNINDEEHLF